MSIEKGLQQHQSGRFEAAIKIYQQYLKQHPNDIQALELLGIAFASIAKFSEAVSVLKELIDIDSNRPIIWNNLGLYQSQLGQHENSINSFEHALRLDPEFREAQKNLVTLSLDQSKFDKAKAFFDNAGESLKSDKKLLSLKAKYFRLVEEYEQSINIYQDLLELNPQSVAAKHNLALTLRLSGQPIDALKHYRELERSGVTQFQLFHNIGNALSDIGRFKEAITYFNRALSLNPTYADSHKNLNALLWEANDTERFLDSYKTAIKQYPDDYGLFISYLSTLINAKEYQAVLDAINTSKLSSDNQGQEYYVLAGRAYKGLEKISEAIAVQKKILDFDNLELNSYLEFASTLLEHGDLNQAELIVEKVLAAHPQNQHAWALQGLVWEYTSDNRARQLNDYENLVYEYAIEAPAEFNSIEEFCAQLTLYLDSLHTAARQPLEQTVVGGTQTRGNLFDNQNPLIQALKGQVSDCINDYISKTKKLGLHTLEKRADEFKFSGSWSVKLHDQGFHTSHVHPMGWISSVFYVDLPSIVDDVTKQEGWFKLGEPDIEISNLKTTTKLIKPKVGKLILFPSYMWHKTLPFSSNQARTTVAFDIQSVTPNR